jgi:hypothetical protein
LIGGSNQSHKVNFQRASPFGGKSSSKNFDRRLVNTFSADAEKIFERIPKRLLVVSSISGAGLSDRRQMEEPAKMPFPRAASSLFETFSTQTASPVAAQGLKKDEGRGRSGNPAGERAGRPSCNY